MRRSRWFSILLVLLLSVPVVNAQIETITFPAGTPEDQGLAAISKEPDPQKKLTMYADFLQQFSSNPAAVAYGNWQIAQAYQGAGDLPKALEYGDKALASAPHNLDILVSQASIAQQMKSNSKLLNYAVRGGEAYNSIGKGAKPEGVSDQDFASQASDQKSLAKNSYDFLEAAAFNVIVDESSAKERMSDIERFTSAFPNSRFEEPVTSYAMMSLSELKDTSRVIAFGERVLAANPNSLPTLLMLAGTYVEDPKPGSAGKAVGYAQKAVAAARADNKHFCVPLHVVHKRAEGLARVLMNRRVARISADAGSRVGIDLYLDAGIEIAFNGYARERIPFREQDLCFFKTL